ncbi:hypothetical protein N7447_005168 [Penicillium robsamsonii]|uniref:uncharacterized protein n=1 Tax=Penicillium robsamsonii TaxID=1792511 RepID=UPI002549467C|nr:uncharacterized protein N7447_005168 [Penicillium robsamsonii]KAJ5822828.1 hypothetical protein N7447_005168 [Penicillium robsamsonii]
MFSDLPAEIHYLIARYLKSKDLYPLVCSSRRLHAVFKRSLYTDVTLNGRQAKDRAVNIFLYAVTRTPRLASFVRSLMVKGWDPRSSNRKNQHRVEFDSNLVRKLVCERTGYSDEERSNWLKDLERDNEDAWLALLILQLRGLRKLGLIWPYGSYYVLVMLQKAAIGSEPIFPHLEEAYVAYADTEGSFSSHYMDAFFKIPSMRKVSCFMLGENEDGDDEEYMPGSDDPRFPMQEIISPRCSNITDIDLEESNAAEGMRELVQACRALKSFRITHGGGQVSYDIYQPRKIYESLSLHKSTLESIWVEPNDAEDYDDEWMGSFVDFTALKVICAFFCNLVGNDEGYDEMRKLRDVLPFSLEILYVSVEYDETFNIAIDQLAELTASESFPKLATIHLEFHGLKIPENVARFECLEQRCQEAGVLCFSHISKWTEEEKQTMGLWPDNEAYLLGYRNWE